MISRSWIVNREGVGLRSRLIKMGIALVVGIGIVAFLLIYFAFSWDKKEHFLLQLFVSFLFVGLLLLVPKALIDDHNHCSIVVNNETVVASTTTYTYTEFCVENTKTTDLILYRVVWGFAICFVLYVFMYFNYVLWLKSKLIDLKLLFKRGKK